MWDPDDPQHAPPTPEEFADMEQEKLDRLMDYAPAGASRGEALAALRRFEAQRERRGLHA